MIQTENKHKVCYQIRKSYKFKQPLAPKPTKHSNLKTRSQLTDSDDGSPKAAYILWFEASKFEFEPKVTAIEH